MGVICMSSTGYVGVLLVMITPLFLQDAKSHNPAIVLIVSSRSSTIAIGWLKCFLLAKCDLCFLGLRALASVANSMTPLKLFSHIFCCVRLPSPVPSLGTQHAVAQDAMIHGF